VARISEVAGWRRSRQTDISVCDVCP